MENKMNAKKLLVSFVMLVSVLFLISTVSAQATVTKVEINGVNVNNNPSVLSGETLSVRVEFEALENAKDVVLNVELEGDRKNVEAETASFDVEDGHSYAKTLNLEVPFDLKSKLSGVYELNLELKGVNFREDRTYELRIQRESYNVDVVSVFVPQTIKAGELFPVDVVLKNVGYNDLEDLYVSANIADLGVHATSFVGDLVALECDKSFDSEDNYNVDVERKCNEDDDDTMSGRIFLQLPSDAEAGVYTLEVKAGNDETVSGKTVQVSVANQFSDGNFIVSGNQLLIVNPSNQIAVYKLLPQSTADVTVSVSESIVSVPAGSSRTVTVDATGSAQEYTVNVFSVDGKLVDTVTFNSALGSGSATSPIVVLTIVLAIIFLVLLVVLIVLIGKKPQKTEEFGESYY